MLLKKRLNLVPRLSTSCHNQSEIYEVVSMITKHTTVLSHDDYLISWSLRWFVTAVREKPFL